MKKTTKLFLMCAMVAVMLTGCKSSDYKKAQTLYQEGNLQEAVTMFQELGDYKDSAALLKEVQFQLACDMQNQGNYADALGIYEILDKDSATTENSMRCKSALAEQLINEKKYDEALQMLADCQDHETAKHFIDICNVHINGLEGIKTYLQEHTDVNSNGNHTMSVETGKDKSITVFVIAGDTSLRLQVEGKNRKSGDPLLNVYLTGDQAGQYSYTHSYLNNVNSIYAYYHDTLLINGKYYTGYIINASGTVNLSTYKKDKEIAMDSFTLQQGSADSLTESQYKTAAQIIIQADTALALEGLQQFLNDQDLRMSIKELGYKKYKLQFAADPYDSANYPAYDYSAVTMTETTQTAVTE